MVHHVITQVLLPSDDVMKNKPIATARKRLSLAEQLPRLEELLVQRLSQIPPVSRGRELAPSGDRVLFVNFLGSGN